MSWQDLLAKPDDSVTVPWTGGRVVRGLGRTFKLKGRQPPEHGWHEFNITAGRTVSWKTDTEADWDLADRFPTGLLQALDRADVVIYLGCNTDHSACGSPELFRQLCGRELLGHVPHRRNTLLIYGRGTRTGPLTGEEFAGLTGALLSFEEAVEKAAENTTHWV